MAVAYYITAADQLSPANGEERETALAARIAAAFAAGIDYVQIREKDWGGKRLGRFVERCGGLPGRDAARLVVNGRADVAKACEADGVHLPFSSLALVALRFPERPAWIVGVSCHNREEAERAAETGASYLLLGPVFPTPSKPEGTPLGLDRFSEICRQVAVPVFALGGVERHNAGECVRAGAAGVAGIRLFQQCPDLGDLCRYLHSL